MSTTRPFASVRTMRTGRERSTAIRVSIRTSRRSPRVTRRAYRSMVASSLQMKFRCALSTSGPLAGAGDSSTISRCGMTRSPSRRSARVAFSRVAIRTAFAVQSGWPQMLATDRQCRPIRSDSARASARRSVPRRITTTSTGTSTTHIVRERLRLANRASMWMTSARASARCIRRSIPFQGRAGWEGGGSENRSPQTRLGGRGGYDVTPWDALPKCSPVIEPPERVR